MTLYLMAEPVDRTLDEFGALGDELRAVGRFHPHRRARLSGPLSVAASAAAPRVLVSAEAVPYRPNRGVYVVVRERPAAPSGPPGPADDPAADPADEMAARLLEAPGVAGVWTFVSDPRFERHRWRPGSRSITVCYLDEEPLEVAPSLGALVGNTEMPPDRPVLFAGPFETITPWRWDWFDDGEG
jgi:hypothetical protein